MYINRNLYIFNFEIVSLYCKRYFLLHLPIQYIIVSCILKYMIISIYHFQIFKNIINNNNNNNNEKVIQDGTEIKFTDHCIGDSSDIPGSCSHGPIIKRGMHRGIRDG